MSRWIHPGPAWEPMLSGTPAQSSYFWMSFLFSLSALTGIVGAASKIDRIHQGVAIWAPTLVGCVLLMVLAAIGAVRAIKKARLNGTEALRRLAFEKFRTYFFCAAFVSLATGFIALLAG